MRGSAFLMLVLLAGCGRTASDLSAAGEPGLNVAAAALRGGSPQIALQVATNILAHNPDNEAALVMQGDALTTLGRTDEAGASYAHALKQNPASADADIGLGRLRLASDPAAAEALFMAALQHDPRNTTALNNLGIARDLQRHHSAAQAAYQQALGIDSRLAAAQVNLALSLAMAGSTGDAVRMMRPMASEPGASRKLRHDFAAVLTMAGDRAEAARILGSDLSPDQVRQAMDAYAAAVDGGRPVVLSDLPPVPVQPASAAVPARRATAINGVSVQFSASPSENDAQNEWQRLQERMPDLLGSRAPEFTRVERDGHIFWRVRTGGFPDTHEAEAFCQQVRSAGGACVVAGA